MSDTTPKIQEFPGIPGKLREATLDEYMIPLTPDHLARRQLADLRQAALDGAKAQAALIKLLEENNQLKEQIRMLMTPATVADVLPPEPAPASVEIEAKAAQPLKVRKPKAE